MRNIPTFAFRYWLAGKLVGRPAGSQGAVVMVRGFGRVPQISAPSPERLCFVNWMFREMIGRRGRLKKLFFLKRHFLLNPFSPHAPVPSSYPYRAGPPLVFPFFTFSS